MSRTFKRPEIGWDARKFRPGYRRVKREGRAIRRKARRPDPWVKDWVSDPGRLAHKIAFKLHIKGWDDEKIRRHIAWKFKLKRWEVMHIVRLNDYWGWNHDCEQCRERRDFIMSVYRR